MYFKDRFYILLSNFVNDRENNYKLKNVGSYLCTLSKCVRILYLCGIRVHVLIKY